MKFKQIFFLIKMFKRNSFLFICSLLIFVLSSIVNLYSAYLISNIVDKGILAGDKIMLYKHAIVLILMQASTIGLGTMGLFLSEHSAHKILYDYKKNFIKQVFYLSPKQYMDYSENEIRMMLTSVIDNLKFFFADLPRIIVEIFILIIGSLFYINIVDSLILYFMLLIIIANTCLYITIKKILFLISEEKIKIAKVWSGLLLLISKEIDELAVNSGKHNIFRVVDQKFLEKCNLDIKNRKVTVFSSMVSNILSHILILSIYLILREKVSLGTVLATITFSAIAFPLFQTCYEMLNYCVQLKPCIDEAIRLTTLSATNETMIKITDNKSGDYYIKSLCFQYSSNKIFENVNVFFKRQGLYTINSQNGSGKTTLLRAVSQAYPVIDGETNIVKEDYEYLLQKSVVLPGSILFNITLQNEISEQEQKKINYICECLKLNDIILNLPQKFHTNIDFQGSILSGGEKRKICIARTLYRGMEKPILFLDEPDAGLDKESVEYLGDILIEMARDKLIVLITHNSYLSNLGVSIVLTQEG